MRSGNRSPRFPENGYPAPQTLYYGSVGAPNAYGRELVEKHPDA
ncbi:hypothetical protein [Ascidiimonas aurantiaca]